MEQAYFFRLAFPAFRVQNDRKELRCVGVLQPTPTSDRYTVEIGYKIRVRPRIQVLKPELRLSPGHAKLPHVFRGNYLCLHLPGQWREDMLISRFIMPWISLWLIFYEVWVVTGEWFGEGYEPSAGAK